MTFAQTFGGTIMISIAQTILSHTLTSQLSITLPGFDFSKISGAGLTNIRDMVSVQQLPEVLAAFNKGIINVFYCALATAVLSLLGSTLLEWKTIKKDTDNYNGEARQDAQT